MPKAKVIAPKNIAGFLQSLGDRSEALKRGVVRDLAAAFFKEVKTHAPDGKDGYRADLSLVSAQAKIPTFAVVVAERSRPVAQVSTESVFVYRAVNRRMERSALFGVLKKYEPYPAELLPVNAATTKAFQLVFKKVSSQEVASIRERIGASFAQIQAELLANKVDPSRLLNPNGVDPTTPAVEDLVWRTIRAERGIQTKRLPVWLPAIARFRADGLKTAAFRMRHLDPHIDKWAAPQKDPVVQTTSEFDDFQRKILI